LNYASPPIYSLAASCTHTDAIIAAASQKSGLGVIVMNNCRNSEYRKFSHQSLCYTQVSFSGLSAGYLARDCSRHAKDCCLRICQGPTANYHPVITVPAWVYGSLTRRRY